ncbi:MAG: hypothetical protein ALECFALPRED_006214 [Alectoria fallacina]|uniref:Methyltransferase domain-containing protein n=1 Tax=Alectoria fallacina TaxID=1903189 RepID=A0A8H3G8Q7_9LECA|nr:MAG: hypothetical protein ALECFALPRED_006214 [Alectoria fallacina]
MATFDNSDMEDQKDPCDSIPRYNENIEEDIAPARTLLEEYSKIPPDQVIAHIHAVRDKAWQIHPYPCLGRFRFLDLSISLHPLYPTVLARLKDSSPPQTFLDLGCCFGQDIRRLVADGAHGENLYGADLRLEFLELGYELFRDKGSLKAHFLEGDVFEEGDGAEGGKGLSKLDGKIDVIYAASFLHLFAWEEQVRAGTRMVRLMRDDSLVFGRQVGTTKPGVYARRTDTGRMRYRHDPDSFQKLWDVIGEKTGTKWKVKAELQKVKGWQSEEQEAHGIGNPRMMQFQVHRLK